VLVLNNLSACHSGPSFTEIMPGKRDWIAYEEEYRAWRAEQKVSPSLAEEGHLSTTMAGETPSISGETLYESHGSDLLLTPTQSIASSSMDGNSAAMDSPPVSLDISKLQSSSSRILGRLKLHFLPAARRRICG